jgi:PPOX class probable F420-dependent enzyme
LIQNPEGVTPSDCLQELDLSRSSLFALLRTLKSLGYIEQSRQRGRYLAGPRLLAWRNTPLSGPQNLLTAFYQVAADPPLDETLALAVMGPDGVIILAQIESSQVVRGVYETGGTIPPENCAASQLLTPFPSQTVRTQGYAVGYTQDLVELALPICKDGHHPDAAFLVSAPQFRQTADSLQSHLTTWRQKVAHISYRLGARTYAPFHLQSLSDPGPTIPLDDTEMDAFLRGPWAARLACVRPDGSPHVVPVWHEWDGSDFYVAAWEGSNWADYLAENPRVSLSVDEPWPPLRRVSVRGTAKAGSIPGELPALLERLSQRYLGQTLHPDLAAQTWQVFRICPDSIRGWRGHA